MSALWILQGYEYPAHGLVVVLVAPSMGDVTLRAYSAHRRTCQNRTALAITAEVGTLECIVRSSVSLKIRHACGNTTAQSSCVEHLILGLIGWKETGAASHNFTSGSNCFQFHYCLVNLSGPPKWCHSSGYV